MAQYTTTLSFDDRTEDILNNLKRDFGAASKAEVIRKAVALLEVIRQAKKDGGAIGIVDADGKSVRTVLVI